MAPKAQLSAPEADRPEQRSPDAYVATREPGAIACELTVKRHEVLRQVHCQLLQQRDDAVLRPHSVSADAQNASTNPQDCDYQAPTMTDQASTQAVACEGVEHLATN